MKYEDLLAEPAPTRKEIQKYIKDSAWQALRRSLYGVPTKTKLRSLRAFKKAHPGRMSAVVVHNYINALKRGGLLK